MRDHAVLHDTPSKRVALVLQGGTALGAYRPAVYECLARNRYAPDCIAGISIGAINAAIIAGNPLADRVSRLRRVWECISGNSAGWSEGQLDNASAIARRAGSKMTRMLGAPGLFRPDLCNGWLEGCLPTRYFETSALKLTLERLIDFDRINTREVRVSLGVVDVETRHFAYFDNAHLPIGPEHVMTSGALPRACPTIQIEDSWYWGAGLVSNTLLRYVLESTPRQSAFAFQVDLFPSQGKLPRPLEEVSEREKDIGYSSCTRAGTEAFREKRDLRREIGLLLDKLLDGHKSDPVVLEMREVACLTTTDIVHLILRPDMHLGASDDDDFTHGSVLLRWAESFTDAKATLDAAPWQQPQPPHAGVRVFDALRDDVCR